MPAVRRSTGIEVNTSTRRAAAAGVKRRRAVAETGRVDQLATRPGRPPPPTRCQRTRRSPRASWATNSMVAVPSSTTTSSSAPHEGQQQLDVAREGVADDDPSRAARTSRASAAQRLQRREPAAARLLPAHLVALVAGQLRPSGAAGPGTSGRWATGRRSRVTARRPRAGRRAPRQVAAAGVGPAARDCRPAACAAVRVHGPTPARSGAGPGSRRRPGWRPAGGHHVRPLSVGGTSDRGRPGGRDRRSATTPATRRSFFIGAELGVVDLLDAVAEGGLDGADVADQAREAAAARRRRPGRSPTSRGRG